jgi:UDP-3-O-[3-hydroxymyristoyl] glucosamine N-acyltransferase
VKLKEIAGVVDGLSYGDKEFEIKNVLSPDEAQESDLTFLSDVTAKTNAGAVISSSKIEGKSGVVVNDVRRAMYTLLKTLARSQKPRGVSAKSEIEDGVQLPKSCTVEPFAVIRKNAVIGNNTYIGVQCYVDENVVIGDNCEIHHHTVIYGPARIGNFVVISANSVIGKEGFGYFKDERYEKIRHIGGIIIENFVELGSNVTVDRGTIGHTVIGEGTKIDNQVHIAHNVKIGRNCIIMGQSGVAGSSHLGDNVILCGQVGISDHLHIEDDVIVYAKSGVFKSLKKGRKYSGTPAREHSAVLRAIARLYGSSEIDQQS